MVEFMAVLTLAVISSETGEESEHCKRYYYINLLRCFQEGCGALLSRHIGSADLAVAPHDVLIGIELLKAHGTAGVQFLR